MRMLEHAMADLRAALRRAAARTGPTAPGRVTPARLVLRLDDADLPGSLGEGDELTLAEWYRLLTSGVGWLRALPVTVLAVRGGRHPYLAELVRFAHRLECHTELVTDGSGMDLARAEELIDCGLAAVRVLVGGVSEPTHHAVVGGALHEATGAVLAFSEARRDRGLPLDIEVAVPWVGPAASEVKAVIGWARQSGVDGFRILAPWRASDLPLDPELLDELSDEPAPFNRTPSATFEELHAMAAAADGLPGLARTGLGFRRRSFPCPVGGQRLEISSHGRLSCCPFKEPIGVAGEDLRESWQGAGPHLQAIAACDRACAHVELAPRPILGQV